MPELPEVEAFAHYIQKKCAALTIKSVRCKDATRVKPNCAILQKKLKNSVIKDVNRRGKYVLVNFKNNKEILIMHFGMSGSVHYTPVNSPFEGSDRFTRVIFIFTNKYELRWIDKRKFGKIILTTSADEIKALKTMGPEPLTLTKREFLYLLEKHILQKIKTFLMAQKNIAGIGNEYSDEILYRAAINPFDTVKNINLQKRITLFNKVKQVLKEAIKLRMNNASPDPKVWLLAHRNRGGHCPKNQNHRLKIAKINSRTSYWCPVCQK